MEASVPRSSKVAKVIDSIKLKLVANLEMVSLELTCEKRSLALISVNTLDANVILKSAYTEVKLFLRDSNVLTKHTDFLSIVEHDALNCKIVLYNLEETKDYNKYDMTIRVEVGGMKIVFVNWFLTSVLSFLANFQAAQQAIKKASKQAAVVAKKNVMTKEKVSRIKMNLYIKAPVIIVPVDSQATNAIAIDFSHLHIANRVSDIIEEEGKAEPLVIDDMKIALEDMRVTRVQILDEHQKMVLQEKGEDEVDLSYGFKAGVNVMEHTPEMDVSGHVQLLEFRLLMDDYGAIMSILNRNLKEGKNEFARVEVETDQRPSMSSAPTATTLPTQVHEEPATKPVEIAKDTPNWWTIHSRPIWSFVPDTTSKITTYMCRKDWLTVDVPDKLISTSLEIISHCLDSDTYILTEFFKVPEIAEAVTLEKAKDLVTLHTTFTRESAMSSQSKKSVQKTLKDVLSYQQQQNQQNEYVYAFLLETNGNTLVHPALAQPNTHNQAPYPVDIGYLENCTEFFKIRQRLLQEESGQAITSVHLIPVNINYDTQESPCLGTIIRTEPPFQ
ncbi:hypothetical protein GQX74_014149 [Glossina fuscipes]|nr:hypothetical protein GQX74_014149 [Glossina fuscipes]